MQIGDGAPTEERQLYIAYAIDMDDKVGCLTQDTFPELTKEQIHQQALSELRNHLASLDWQIQTQSVGMKNYTLAYFEGDYYAAEVFLSIVYEQYESSPDDEKQITKNYSGMDNPFDCEADISIQVIDDFVEPLTSKP